MTYINAPLRREVISRAGGCCEYCRISREDHVLPFEIDHVIAEKHGGPTVEDNLALSCYDCNSNKGSDLCSYDWETDTITPLFNPRKHRWSDHFRLNAGQLEPLTPTGRVTITLLHFNDSEGVEERALLVQLRRYPC